MTATYDILVVDDEQVILDAIKKICSLENLRVDIAQEATKVLDKIQNASYRLILCDIMMPEITGFQFLFELQKMEIDIPIIMITGYTTTENAIVSLRNGAIDFLPKPFTIDELWSAIRRGLRYGDLFRNTAIVQKETQPADATLQTGSELCYRLGYTTRMKINDNGLVIVGVTSRFMETIEAIDKIELLPVGARLSQGNYCARLNGQDNFTYALPSPVSGKIFERNEKLLYDAAFLHTSTFEDGWLYKLIPEQLDYEKQFLIPCRDET
jgi:FixJ family two-component response regulator/glycine cleavage system H lipoate-binding protein